MDLSELSGTGLLKLKKGAKGPQIIRLEVDEN